MQLSNGNYTFTDANGYYQIQADTIGAYTLTIIPPTGYNALPATVSYNFTTWDTVITKDIALQPTVVFDSVAINVIPMAMNAVQNNPMPYWIQYINAGTTTLSPTVSLTYNNYLLAYDSCTDINAVPTANGIATGTLNMQPGQLKNLIAYFTVKSAAPIGDTLSTVYNITTSSISATDSFYMIVESGTPNPNAQRATPSITQAQVAAGADISYTIGFKNTGADTAFNVIITDTLSPSLQANTLQMVASSHTCRTTVKGNIVTFELLNIKLPKASANNLKSMGFVSFKIKPKTTLIAGTIITNKAYTYYNYRTPVSSTATTIVKAVVTPVLFKMYDVRFTMYKTIENNWTTANEINVSHYNIQRSTIGKNFETVGKEIAKNKNINEYSFIDSKLPPTNDKLTIYYRLQSVDNDGKISYSTTQQITIKSQIPNSINIYPNPANDVVNIECANAKEIAVFDYLGRDVYKKSINQQSNNIQPYLLNIKSLKRGIYQVRVLLQNGYTKSQTLMVE